MKPNKDFKLSKSAKRLLATKHGEERTMWKKLYIESEIAEDRKSTRLNPVTLESRMPSSA